MHVRRDAYAYVGVDPYKRFHVAAMVDSYGEPVGKPLKFENSHAPTPPGWSSSHVRPEA